LPAVPLLPLPVCGLLPEHAAAELAVLLVIVAPPGVLPWTVTLCAARSSDRTGGARGGGSRVVIRGV